MKLKRITQFTALCATITFLGLVAAIPDGIAAETKSKPKTSSSSSKAKASDEKAKEKTQLKKASEMLKVLSTQKKSALTRLLNSGKQVELEALPGVGKATAEAIMKARPLDSSAHLILIKGIGEKTFKEIVDSRK